MNTRITTVVISLFAAIFGMMKDAEADPTLIVWPPKIFRELDAVLVCKDKAMALRHMRSENGILGKEVEAAMDRLADLLTNEKFAASLREPAKTDIRARIALWALDRKTRPDEYRRFAKYYVNCPDPQDSVDYFIRRNKALREKIQRSKLPPGHLLDNPAAWQPDPVDPEDQVETNRYILEYCYFMPPTGMRFARDTYRGNIAEALRKMPGASGSLVVFEDDIRAAMRIVEVAQMPEFAINVYISFRQLCLVPVPESFASLAGNWNHALCHKEISTFLAEYWAGEWDIGYGRYPANLHNWEAWTALAKRPWDKPGEQEFAKWILSQPAPKDPDAPKPGTEKK